MQLKHLQSTLAVVALAFFFSSSAVEAAGLKVGFVDADRINRESAPAVAAGKRLEKEFAPRAQELQRREREVKDLQAQLEKDVTTMSEGARRAKEQELSHMTLEFQRLSRSYTEDLNLRRNQELQTLLQRADRVIKEIAESEKYDLIVQDAVHHSARLDITERVLKALAAQTE